MGFGVNQVVTFNHMLSDTFGIGGGVALAEGMIGTFDSFVDFRINKWNLGAGLGYDYKLDAIAYILRGV